MEGNRYILYLLIITDIYITFYNKMMLVQEYFNSILTIFTLISLQEHKVFGSKQI
jgi:hypothetical protein